MIPKFKKKTREKRRNATIFIYSQISYNLPMKYPFETIEPKWEQVKHTQCVDDQNPNVPAPDKLTMTSKMR